MTEALKVDFNKEEWDYLITAFPDTVSAPANALFLLNYLDAQAKIKPMPQGLSEKLDSLDLIDCAILYNSLMQIWSDCLKIKAIKIVT